MSDPREWGLCATCKFWATPHGSRWASNGGECRRRSPVVIQNGGLGVETRFPKIRRDESCGEFEGVCPPPVDDVDENGLLTGSGSAVPPTGAISFLVTGEVQ